MTQADLFDGEASKVERRPQDISEAEVQEKCVDYLRDRGAYARKFSSPANRSVPDYIFTWRAWTWYVEFKRRGKAPTDAQALEHAKIREAGGVVWVIDNVAEFRRRIRLMSTTGDLYVE